MTARENILARLRKAPAGAPAPLPDVGSWFAATVAKDATERTARFKANIEAAHAEVHETSEADWPALLFDLAAQKGLRSLLVGNGTAQAATLRLRLQETLRVVSYDSPAATWRAELFENVDAALTTARSAIASTGSLILWPDASEPRLMSLVPPVHFVLLDAANIHNDLHAAMTSERWAEAMPTNALVISGPSKTADIQQTLAYGAHGPRELIVLLCRRSGVAS
jgi:L-lactate dehydrogenase complex protein LldG